jgi:hypothetical protein
LNNLIIKITNINRTQHDIDASVSLIFGEMNTINPCSLIKAEKLETQNGMRYNLKVCQGSLAPILLEETLSIRPVPITALIPIELIHILTAGAK